MTDRKSNDASARDGRKTRRSCDARRYAMFLAALALMACAAFAVTDGSDESSAAADYTQNNINYEIYDTTNNFARVIASPDATDDVEILSEITVSGNTCAVNQIGNYAFNTNKKITSVTIPASVVSIGSFAFNGCSNLGTVTFENGSNLETIGEGAFLSCNVLTSLTIPASVVSIGDDAFRACSSLEAVNFSDSSDLRTIGARAFRFAGLTAVTIPAKVTTIGEWAFQNCSKLKSVSFAGIALETVNKYAFSESGLTAVTIPDTVTTLGEGVFYRCHHLSNAKLGIGVTEVQTATFEECVSLVSVTVGASSVTKIWPDAFRYCISLFEVINLSNLTLDYGSDGNGGIAKYAKSIVTDPSDSTLMIVDGYTCGKGYDGINYAIVVDVGADKKLLLPQTIGGTDYTLAPYFHPMTDGTVNGVPDELYIPSNIKGLDNTTFKVQYTDPWSFKDLNGNAMGIDGVPGHYFRYSTTESALMEEYVLEVLPDAGGNTMTLKDASSNPLTGPVGAPSGSKYVIDGNTMTISSSSNTPIYYVTGEPKDTSLVFVKFLNNGADMAASGDMVDMQISGVFSPKHTIDLVVDDHISELYISLDGGTTSQKWDGSPVSVVDGGSFKITSIDTGSYGGTVILHDKGKVTMFGTEYVISHVTEDYVLNIYLWDNTDNVHTFYSVTVNGTETNLKYCVDGVNYISFNTGDVIPVQKGTGIVITFQDTTSSANSFVIYDNGSLNGIDGSGTPMEGSYTLSGVGEAHTVNIYVSNDTNRKFHKVTANDPESKLTMDYDIYGFGTVAYTSGTPLLVKEGWTVTFGFTAGSSTEYVVYDNGAVNEANASYSIRSVGEAHTVYIYVKDQFHAVTANDPELKLTMDYNINSFGTVAYTSGTTLLAKQGWIVTFGFTDDSGKADSFVVYDNGDFTIVDPDAGTPIKGTYVVSVGESNHALYIYVSNGTDRKFYGVTANDPETELNGLVWEMPFGKIPCTSGTPTLARSGWDVSILFADNSGKAQSFIIYDNGVVDECTTVPDGAYTIGSIEADHTVDIYVRNNNETGHEFFEVTVDDPNWELTDLKYKVGSYDWSSYNRGDIIIVKLGWNVAFGFTDASTVGAKSFVVYDNGVAHEIIDPEYAITDISDDHEVLVYVRNDDHEDHRFHEVTATLGADTVLEYSIDNGNIWFGWDGSKLLIFHGNYFGITPSTTVTTPERDGFRYVMDDADTRTVLNENETYEIYVYGDRDIDAYIWGAGHIRMYSITVGTSSGGNLYVSGWAPSPMILAEDAGWTVNGTDMTVSDSVVRYDLSASPDSGYRFTGFAVNGKSIQANGNFASDAMLTAVFKKTFQPIPSDDDDDPIPTNNSDDDPVGTPVVVAVSVAAAAVAVLVLYVTLLIRRERS